MPTWAPGSEALTRQHAPRPAAARGFTLLELMIVLSLLAVVVATVTLSIRDPSATQLEREAERLSALLEAGRAESRTSGVAVRWQPVRNPEEGGDQFRFVGLPDAVALPTRWLNEGVRADIIGSPLITLGPEPIIGAQRITLSLDDRRVSLATDGLQPFAIVPEAPRAP